MTPPGPIHTPHDGDDPWIAVAQVLRPRGLQGVLRLKPLTANSDDLLEHRETPLHVRRGGIISGPHRLLEGYVEKDILFVRLDGITDRTAADALVHADLVVRESELWAPGEDAWFLHELEGLALVDAETNETIGNVLAAREGAAHDYLEIELTSHPGKKLLLPLIEEFVQDIDLAARKVHVRIPEGLAD